MRTPQSARQTQPAAAQPQVAGRVQSVAQPASDELPPSAREHRSRATNPPTTGGGIHWTKLGLLAAAAVAGLSLWPLKNQEASSSNWPLHQDARAEVGAKWVGRGASQAAINGIALGQSDQQPQVTRQIQSALRSNSLDAANQALQAANAELLKATTELPGPVGAIVQPTLSQEMARQLDRGESSVFQVHLYDSCYEDGDIVELLINGHHYATVPITNRGLVLSIPLANRGSTSVVVRGISDGGGGITVACETSQGTGFVRVLAVGEEQAIGFGNQ